MKPRRKRKGWQKQNALLPRRELDSIKSIVNISKQLERHENRLARIEKVILPLQKSVNKIEKQSNTIKQLYTVVTQLQRQIRSTKKKGKNLARSRSKKRSPKGRRQR